ncbi:MAG: glycosyltransferase [Lachnospiraceae bacterium]|nr:glycosyltransferase [Lachnospiraceae bacterium]
MIKVSVIVPVYNAEKYLAQCLDSILAQTLQEIEIVCVDDGSTDNSGKILDQYAMQDKRVKVLHRENRGYGAAMNAGLDTAAGEYVGIVESDDCILPEMYRTLYEAADAEKPDVVKSDAYFWYETIGYRKNTHPAHLNPCYDRTLGDVDRNIFFDFYMNIWTGIYKRELLISEKIRFHESPGASYQDNGFWLQTLLYCKKAKWISQAFYLYRQDNEASSVKSRDKVFVMTREYEYIEKLLLERKDYDYLPYCYYYRMLRHRGNFLRIADEYKREFCEQVCRDYAKYKSYIKGFGGLDHWLREMALDPDRFCENAIKTRHAINERLRQAKSLIIYGAGHHGDRVFRGLVNEGYYDTISCFAVSKVSTEREMAGKQIVKIDNAVKGNPDALVIVAVIRGSGMYMQMAKRLSELGVTEYLDGTDIEENFYIL